jgi:hypothetical protein
MVLQDYTISDDRSSINILKSELQSIQEHYIRIADKFNHQGDNIDASFALYMYYKGKSDVALDMLKMFETIDFE